MSACIIQKKDLEKLGKKLMKKIYYHLHDDYFLEKFEEVKLKRKYYDENLTKEFLSFYDNQRNIGSLYSDNERYRDLIEMKTEDLLKKIETKIKNETLNDEIIYDFLVRMKMKLKINLSNDLKINEDLFYMEKAFFNLFSVYHFDHHYLED